jgi:hypothetical protein
MARRPLAPVLIALLAAGPAAAADRATNAAQVFADYCLKAAPDFEALSRRANDAHGQLFVDRTLSDADGARIRQKNWLITDPGGSLLVTTEEGEDRGAHVTGCGIIVLDAAGPDVEQALTAVPELGPPAKRDDPAPSGGITVWWRVQLAKAAPTDQAQVMLAYNLPGEPGAAVNLIYRTRPGSASGPAPAGR